MEPWGILSAIDAVGCDPISINCTKTFQKFIDELLDTIEMIKIGDLHVIWCTTNDPKKIGWSGFQLLQDSNVTFHFCPKDQNAAFVDIFSCKPYDPQVVLDIFCKYFNPEKSNIQVLERYIPK